MGEIKVSDEAYCPSPARIDAKCWAPPPASPPPLPLSPSPSLDLEIEGEVAV